MEKITLNEIPLTLQRAKVVILTDVAYLERSNGFSSMFSYYSHKLCLAFFFVVIREEKSSHHFSN